MEAVHGELRRLARRYMRQERLDHTLQPTALVHEAYLRLFPGREVDWKDHSELLRCAARAMRQILVDHARSRNRAKRGGDFKRVPLDSGAAVVSDQQPSILVALDESLTRLAGLDPRQAEIVELLYFTGLTQEELAASLGIKQPTLSKLESQADMQISTLQRLIEALGGKLELIAHLPGGDVRISQFMPKAS